MVRNLRTLLFGALSLLFILGRNIHALAGTITPYGANPITNSIANRLQYADYTFSFSVETTLPAGGLIRITFPSQFPYGLGITPTTPTCYPSCTVEGFDVYYTITSQLLGGVATTVNISQVLNPSAAGGTGNFQIRTYKGSNLLDENLIFGLIGVAGDIGALTSTTVAVDSSGTSSAGALTKYAFSFKTASSIPAGSYFKFTISDPGYGISDNPTCEAFAITGVTISGTLTCNAVSGVIYVYGLAQALPPSSSVGITVTMTNPTVSRSTSTFAIAIFRESTTVIFDQKTGIPGVQITPGTLSSISIKPYVSNCVQAKGKTMDYVVSFLPKNTLHLGSIITVSFPTTFVIYTVRPKYYIMSGLTDIDEDTPVGMQLSGNTITLSNFQEYATPSLIKLYIRATNPSSPGQTTPITITTYTDYTMTQIQDQDISTGYTTISTVPTPAAYGAAAVPNNANGVLTTLTFTITPTISVPASGYITILIPTAFVWSIEPDSTKCSITASGVTAQSARCSRVDNLLTMQLQSTQTFLTGVSSSFSINNVLLTPTQNGTYIFDINTYQANGATVIESYSTFITINPTPLTPVGVSVSSLCIEPSKSSILVVTFTNQFDIPTGMPQTTASDLRGFIEIELSGSVALNLGYSSAYNYMSVPCKPLTGIVAIEGGELNCQLLLGTSTPATNPRLLIRNFEAISAGTYCQIHFSQFTNPGSTFNYEVKLWQKQSWTWVKLNTDTGSVTLTAGSGPGLTNVANSAYSFTNPTGTAPKVSAITDMTMNVGLITTILASSAIIIELPHYDIGWIPTQTETVTCIVGAGSQPCISYSGSDWVYIQLSSTQTVASTGSGPIWTIGGLRVPRYSVAAATGLPPVKIRVLEGGQEVRIYTEQNVPAPTTLSFKKAVLYVPKKGAGYVNCEYIFSFRIEVEIPAGAEIQLNFPPQYSLLASYPPIRITSPELKDRSSTQPVTFTPSSNSIVVTSFDTHPKDTTFTILVNGVKNPTSVATASPFDIYITYGGNPVASYTSFTSFTFTGEFSPGVVIFSKITAFPSNANQYADYTISFTPRNEIPAGGIVQITFPSANYSSSVLPSNPICSVSGGITTFTRCYRSGYTVYMILDSSYTTGGMAITIKNVLNPSAGTTSGFVVRTKYDGVFLDNTDLLTTVGRTVTITARPGLLSVHNLDFWPKNEAEPATYTFTFLPTYTITSSMYISIHFPSVYDQLLGSETIQCASLGGLTGAFTCTVSNRVLTLSGFDTYIPNDDNPITLQISKVVNPNQNINFNTGQFKIATYNLNSLSYVDYNPNAGAFVVTSAPQWAVLTSIIASNYDTRLAADYQFNFSLASAIPVYKADGSGGAILVVLPGDFSENGTTYTCTTTATTFASSLKCSSSLNTITVLGNSNPTYTGVVVFNISNIKNPEDRGSAGKIVLKTYDGFNKVILQRSFPNLDPFSFYFDYPGPIISVNNDADIIVNAGTQSQSINISLWYPCALNLTLKPILPGFSVIPFSIELLLSEPYTTFKISVPQNFQVGYYYVSWITYGDLTPAYYTPLQKSRIIITQLSNILITVPTVPDIPRGGNSLPVIFTVQYGPDVGFEITVSLAGDYEGVSLSKKNVVFSAGSTSASFLILASVNATISRGQVNLGLTGVNKDIYTLSSGTIDFQLVDPITSSAEITELDITSVTQTTATIVIGTSDLGIAYYMIALANTITPTYEEVSNQGPPTYLTTLSQYGYSMIGTTNRVEIKVTGLIAQTPYQVYVYVTNRAGLTNNPKSQTFTTADRYPAANFNFQFKQAYLNTAEKANIMTETAFILSLSTSKIQIQKYFFRRRMLDGTEVIEPEEEEEQHQERNLQSTTISTIVYLQLKPSPNTEVFPSPVELALSLNNNRTVLASELQNFDASYAIPATEFKSYVPVFFATPTASNISIYWTQFSVELDTYGFVYVVCVKSSEDLGKPSAYQVSQGFNGSNVQYPSGSVEVSTAFKVFNINVTGLDALTEYNAYFVGGSVHPGYPDLMNDDSVVSVAFTTLPPDYIPPLSIVGGTLLKQNLIILLCTLLFLYLV